MSVASEITRLQNAKASLKSSINAKTDQQHQIADETLDEYADFVDSITSGGGDLDWSAIGYESTPREVVDGYNYAKQIYDNWDNTITDMSDIFRNDKKLVYFPLVDTSNVTNMRYMFLNCRNLTTIPVLNTSKVTTMNSAFQSNNLTDEGIDNILQMCINATSYETTKTLRALAFNSSTQTVERIQALPHYQDFIDAGWTIGY